MKDLIPQNISAALRTYGIRPFQVESGGVKHDAQRNLSGRTHYVDDGTLGYWKSRILDSGMWHPKCETHDLSRSLVYWIVESVGSRPNHRGVNKRFIAFDVFGTVITARDDWHRSADAARKAGLAELAKLDPVKHTRDELKRRVKADMERGKATLAALRHKEA